MKLFLWRQLISPWLKTAQSFYRGACDCWGDPEEDFVLFSIVEVICHGVETIEENAFRKCPYLRRVIMPGVRVVGEGAFWGCSALTGCRM